MNAAQAFVRSIRPALKKKGLPQPENVRAAAFKHGVGVGVQELPMSKMAGVVLILSGLALAAYGLSSEEDANGSNAARRIEVAKHIGVQVTPAADAPAPLPQSALRAAASAARSEPASASPPVVVTLAPRPSDAAHAPSRMVAIPKDRDSLARELQKELKRVGCYAGELNGAWTLATRRAMKTFTDRLNATLPVDEPDAVLFALVESQQDRVCGKPCPAGQGQSEDGRCLPNAILAKAGKKPAPPGLAANVAAGDAPAAGKPAGAITGWSTTVRATSRPSPPSIAATPAALPAPPQTAVSALAPSAATPPQAEGRMALAGPTEETPPSGAATPAPGSPDAAGLVATPRPLLQTPPKRVVQGSNVWTRMMNARRFDSPN